MKRESTATSQPFSFQKARREHACLIAKLVNDYIKATRLLAIKGGLLGKQLIDADGVKQLAELPGRDALLGQLAGTLNHSVAQLASALNGSVAKLAIRSERIGQLRPHHASAHRENAEHAGVDGDQRDAG